MPDQADILRHLVADALRGKAACASSPPLVAVAGAKGGVGATCIAIALAEALARQGQRVVLVDVDPQSANVAALCGIVERYTTADVLAGRREIHEVLQSAPGGLQIAAGAWATENCDVSPAAQRRLLNQLRRLGNYADVILLDVGCGTDERTMHYWQAADRVLLVTSPDAVAVMDAYAAIKVATMHDITVDVEILVNQAETSEQAASVHQRINHSCQRFLGVHVAHAGEVPLDAQLARAARQQNMLALSPEASAAVQAIDQLAAMRNFAALAAA